MLELSSLRPERTIVADDGIVLAVNECAMFAPVTSGVAPGQLRLVDDA